MYNLKNDFLYFLGKSMAQDFNFPEDIFDTGIHSQWTVTECLKNLSILVEVDNGSEIDVSPAKKTKN